MSWNTLFFFLLQAFPVRRSKDFSPIFFLLWYTKLSECYAPVRSERQGPFFSFFLIRPFLPSFSFIEVIPSTGETVSLPFLPGTSRIGGIRESPPRTPSFPTCFPSSLK